jgi:hypothetical protein
MKARSGSVFSSSTFAGSGCTAAVASGPPAGSLLTGSIGAGERKDQASERSSVAPLRPRIRHSLPLICLFSSVALSSPLSQPPPSRVRLFVCKAEGGGTG